MLPAALSPDPAIATLPARPRWQLCLLGGFVADDGRHQVQRLRSRAAMALLARLAMAPRREHDRETLAGLLWPQADAEVGRRRLRQTLSLLKSVLEPPGSEVVLQADRRAIRVVPEALGSDVLDFEQAVARADLAAAQALYAGELLPGFYDEWIVDERHRLQALLDRLAQPMARASLALPPTPPPTAMAPRTAVTAALAMPRSGGVVRVAQGLPQYLTRLFGSVAQLQRLCERVRAQRWVTLLGAGGVGKTRLAVEAARRLTVGEDTGTPRPAFERAVFVPLVGVSRALEVQDRLQSALRIEAAGSGLDQMVELLHSRPVLMLLDNVEQLEADAKALLARMAEQLPTVHWLLTSRRPLELDGEQLFSVEPLPAPPPQAALAEVAANPAVVLFVDRARAHRAEFQVNAGNREGLAALVRWLEGLPLAIELAAAQVRHLQPGELLALLQAARRGGGAERGSLAMLARRGPRSGTDPRHASMQAVVEGSWNLLSPASRELVQALSLLPVGGTRGTVACVLQRQGASEALALQQQLDELVQHSVLRAMAGRDGELRFAPLEPVREFALGRASAPWLRCARGRHLDSLLRWAREMPATPPLPSVRDELPNIAAAMTHAAEDGRADDAVHLVLLLQSAWGEIAVPAGVLATLSRLLDSPGLNSARAACAHALAATSCQEAGQAEAARQHMQRALALPCDDTALRATVLSRLARLRWRLDRDAAGAREFIELALPLARQAQRPNTEASLLSLKGYLFTAADRAPALGAPYTAQSLALWQRSGNRHLINAGRYNVAVNAVRAGRPAQVLDELAALAREGLDLQDWDLASGALEAHGTALLALRRWNEAWCSLHQSLSVAWDGLEMLATVYALWNVAPALARLRQGELAARTMGAAEAQWSQRFGAPDAADLRDLRRMRRFARALLGPRRAGLAWAEGAALPLPAAVQGVLEASISP